MFDDLAIARADGRLSRLMAAWARISVLVIDDLLLRPLTGDQAADLLEVIEDRARLRATIITSQLPVSHWHEAIGDPTIADAALDRLLENANRKASSAYAEHLEHSPLSGHSPRTYLGAVRAYLAWLQEAAAGGER